MQSFETIQLTRGERRAGLTLARPEEQNAISTLMVRELEQAAHALEDDPGEPVLVLRGAGEAFCRGIDLRDFPPDQKPDVRGFSRWERACRTLERLPMATVAAVHGVCVGGGLQLALACDLRVVTEDATFQLPEVRHGFLPGMGTFRLAKFIGLGRARHMALSGRVVSAEEAVRIGLVDRVCPAGALDRGVEEAIAELGEVHTDAVALCRRLFDESFEIPYEDFLGCFLAAQHRAIQGDAFKARVRRVHQETRATHEQD